MPIPKIEVSIYQSPEIKERDSLKNFIEVPETKDISPLAEVPFASIPKSDEDNIMSRRASEKVKRKMKMADLKAFVETKLLSKSEKALEKIGHDDHKFSFHTAVRMISVDIFFISWLIKYLVKSRGIFEILFCFPGIS